MNCDFTPVVWPEDKVPARAKGYEECQVCTEKSRVIWGEGNPKASIVVILDNSGARKDKDGMDYVCGTRETLQKAANQVNLSEKDIYLTYLLKCRPLAKYDKEEARAFSKPYLAEQINNIKPKIILCLGDVVVQTMFDDKQASVKDLRESWHTILGYPALVSYHPLAVRRRPNLLKYFMKDWELLAEQGGALA